MAQDLVREPVLHRFLRGEDLVAVHVRAQRGDVVVGVPGQDLLDLRADPQHLLGLEAEVRHRALTAAAGRLAEQHAGVFQDEPPPGITPASRTAAVEAACPTQNVEMGACTKVIVS